MSPPRPCRHCRVTGRVQGVGFRDWTAAQARRLDLSGWVRNCRDGSVEAVFCGDRSALEDMIARLRRGPLLARVDDVTCRPLAAPLASDDVDPGRFERRADAT